MVREGLFVRECMQHYWTRKINLFFPLQEFAFSKPLMRKFLKNLKVWIKLKEPNSHIWVSSPRAETVIVSVGCLSRLLFYKTRDGIWDEIQNEKRARIRGQIRVQIWEETRGVIQYETRWNEGWRRVGNEERGKRIEGGDFNDLIGYETHFYRLTDGSLKNFKLKSLSGQEGSRRSCQNSHILKKNNNLLWNCD